MSQLLLDDSILGVSAQLLLDAAMAFVQQFPPSLFQLETITEAGEVVSDFMTSYQVAVQELSAFIGDRAAATVALMNESSELDAYLAAAALSAGTGSE